MRATTTPQPKLAAIAPQTLLTETGQAPAMTTVVANLTELRSRYFVELQAAREKIKKNFLV
jgi:hypothetical protein